MLPHWFSQLLESAFQRPAPAVSQEPEEVPGFEQFRGFPEFFAQLKRRQGAGIEHILPPATLKEIATLEDRLGIALPPSYRRLMQCSSGFRLLGGSIQFCEPDFHKFPEWDCLSPQQQMSIQGKGGVWPPPSHGMLCFAEFHLEADGDQVLWDVSQSLQDGEYPIVYYAHESNPPCVRKLADCFESWLGNCFSYFEVDGSGL